MKEYLLAVATIALAIPSASWADNIYVSNISANSILEFSSTGGIPGVFVTTGANTPEGLALDGAGNLYVAYFGNTTDVGNASIETFAPDGTGSVFANTSLKSLFGLAIDNSGNLYSVDAGGAKIEKFAGNVGSDFAAVNGASGLAVDGSENLYVSSSGDNVIYKITPGGVKSIFANMGLDNPDGLAFDAAGNLFAANFGDNTIEEFSPNGDGTLFANIGLSHPRDLAFDSVGNLYVVNETSNSIEMFTPNGAGSVFASGLGMDNPGYIAIQSALVIPEPWSLAISGGVVMVLLFRRHRACM